MNRQTITIPRTVDAAARTLTELGELATATEWHRAAIVAAYVQEREGQGQTLGRTAQGLESARDFAARKIHGLKSHHTVLIYLRAWMEQVGKRPVPGQEVKLPTEPWPPTALADGRYVGVIDREAIEAQAAADGTGATKAVDIAKNTKAMAAAIKASPAVAAAAAAALGPQVIAQAVAKDPAVARLVNTDTAAQRALIVERAGREQRQDAPRPGEAAQDLKENGQVFLLMSLAAKAAVAARELHETMASMNRQPWRPVVHRQIVKDIEDAIDYLSESKVLMTSEVTDEALRDLLDNG